MEDASKVRCVLCPHTFDMGIMRTFYRPFASVGALLAIVQLIVSPLAQNAILYRSWGVSIPNSQGATVQAAQNFSEITGQALYSTSPNMQSAIQRGIFSGESVIDPIRPLCSSGNCTWAPYQSLAVCASSANITLKLKNSKNGYTLPGGPYLKPGPTDVILNFSSVGIQESTEDGSDFLNFNRSSAYKNVSSPIADVFFVYQPKPQPLSGTGQGGTVVEPPDPDPNAIEFVLQWCVQTFTTTVLNGIPDTQKTTTFLNFTHTAEEMDPITGELKNSSFAVYVTAHPNPDDPNDVFTIEPSTHANLQNYFQQLFQGNVSMPGGADVHSSSSVAQILFQSFDPPDAGNKTAMDPTVQLGGLNFILDNIAVSMTNYIRANAQNDLVLGTLLLQGQTTVRVQWGYLVAPIVFMILCLLFFATTIVYQRSRSVRVKNWKSSSLAVLHALGPEIHRELGGMSKASVLKEEAERTAVKLVRQEGSEGWRLRDAEEREGKGEAGAGDRYL